MSEAPAYTLFETSLGLCGIAWSERGITAFQLPEATDKLTESRIAQKSSAKKASGIPSRVMNIIKRVQLHLAGKSQDFGEIQVDLDGAGQFRRKVYEACRNIPAGSTMTYGELGKTIARPGAARAVGQAMGRNPIPLIIPCHRVLASGNRPGGFSAHGGLAVKAKMLAIEGVTLGPPPVITSTNDLRGPRRGSGKRTPGRQIS